MIVMVSGDRWQGIIVVDKWDDHEVHGTEAGSHAQTLQHSWESQVTNSAPWKQRGFLRRLCCALLVFLDGEGSGAVQRCIRSVTEQAVLLQSLVGGLHNQQSYWSHFGHHCQRANRETGCPLCSSLSCLLFHRSFVRHSIAIVIYLSQLNDLFIIYTNDFV